MSKREQRKRDQKRHQEGIKRQKKNAFLRYVENSPDLDLPPANAHQDILTAYVNKVSPLVEGHENEPGSALLAWRAGTVLNWLKERCDKGQLDIGDGELSTFIPKELRTFDGEPAVFEVSAEEFLPTVAKLTKKHKLIPRRDESCEEVYLLNPDEDVAVAIVKLAKKRT